MSATANRKPNSPDIMTKPSGLIRGDEVRKAMIGPQGRVVVSIPTMTAIVPHAQKGVNAPINTLARMETFDLRNRIPLNRSVLT